MLDYESLLQEYAAIINGLFVVGAFVALWILVRPNRLYKDARRPAHLRSVAIVVLGDIGRSPRMMYHAESFANHGFETFLIGYKGSELIPSLQIIPHVRLMPLAQPYAFISKLPRPLFLLLAPFKVLQQILTVLHTLLRRMPYPPEFIVVQNPPTIPTLALVQLVCWMHSCKLVIDWHNLGYTILALRLGEGSRLVQFAKWFEKTFGRAAFAHLFVTEAMKERLVSEWHLRGIKVVLHDRPPKTFHHAEPSEVHDLFRRLDLNSEGDNFLPHCREPVSTPFTRMKHVDSDTNLSLMGPSALPQLRADRPALLVSSTSWTPDEDFSILLEALNLYEKRACEQNGGATPETRCLPKLLVIITGKGPQREMYTEKIQDLQQHWKWVRCLPMWLKAEDYPILLGSADLGVSLHASSSAVDLPMKIVDMFGCGLPVCALNFPCLHELVKDGKNGLVFENAQQLAEQLESLLRGFPDCPNLLNLRNRLRSGDGQARSGGRTWSSWEENWDVAMQPIITHIHGPERIQ